MLSRWLEISICRQPFLYPCWKSICTYRRWSSSYSLELGEVQNVHPGLSIPHCHHGSPASGCYTGAAQSCWCDQPEIVQNQRKDPEIPLQYSAQPRSLATWTRCNVAESKRQLLILCCVLELSRVIMSDPQPHDHETADEIETSIQAFTCEAIAQLSDHIGSITHAQIKAAAHSDPDYMSLILIIRTGFPATRHMTDPKIRQFWEVRTRLSVEDDIALLNDRIIIPAALRKRVLQCLHSAHQGVTSMRARANCTVYWPGMNASIRNFRECCIACRT